MTSPEVTKLDGTPRDTGRRTSVDLRAEKRVPAVLYGPNVAENIHFSVKELDLERILSVAATKLQDLTIEGSTHRTLLKNVEFDPVTDRPIHADFYVLSDTHPVSLTVPVRLIGTPKGVLEGGGRLFQPLKTLRIKVLPDKIPAEFAINVAQMEVGQMLRVSDLELDGIIPLEASTRTIVMIKAPKGGKKTTEETGKKKK